MYKISSEVNYASLSKFILNHPHGNIFQTPEMYEVYRKTDNYETILIIVVDENDEICGVLLSSILNNFNGLLKHFTSRSIIYGGPLVKNNSSEILDIILKEYKKRIKGKAIYSQFRNIWDWNNNKAIFISNGFTFIEHLDILHDLTFPLIQQWSNLNGSAKNKVNKSTKSNVLFKELDLNIGLDETLSILKVVYQKAGLPLASKSFFTNAFDILGRSNNLKLFAALKDNCIIGIRLILIYKSVVYDWYAGGKNKYNNYNPNDFLAWKVIEWGSLNGYSTFDFGGAGQPNIPYGVRDYKLKFGGELVSFGRFELIHNLSIYKIATECLHLWKKIKSIF